jgi:hypothetical protein
MQQKVLHDAVYEFGVDMLRWVREHHWEFFGEEWSVEVCPILLKHGFVAREPYDPEVHGEDVEAEPGEAIWTFTERLKAL